MVASALLAETQPGLPFAPSSCARTAHLRPSAGCLAQAKNELDSIKGEIGGLDAKARAIAADQAKLDKRKETLDAMTPPRPRPKNLRRL